MFKTNFSSADAGFNANFDGYEVLRGEDGFSPDVEITPINDGYQVKITDKDGTETFEVLNGKDGAIGPIGPIGPTGPQGERGETGPKGEKGDRGAGTVIGLDIGEGEDSIQQEGAKALGPRTIALGASVAGCKGYYYSHLCRLHHADGSTTAIVLSETQTQPEWITAKEIYYLEDKAPAPIGWEIGDKVSIVNGSHYDEAMTISSIYDNVIVLEGQFPFEDIYQGDTGLDAYSICVPSKPECGVISLGEGAFAAGDDVKATGRYSSSFGRQNHSFGDYSFTAGRKCRAAYGSGAIGYECEALGQGSFSAGWQCKSTGRDSVTAGGGLNNPYDNAFIGGWCNDPTIPDLLWGIGYGFDGVRKNAFNVDIYGNVWVDKDPTMPMGVATRQYVNNIAKTKRVVTTDNNPALVRPNAYYVLTGNGTKRANVNLCLIKSTDNNIVNEYKFRIDNTEMISFYYRDASGNDSPITSIKGFPETYNKHLLTLDPTKTYEFSIIDEFAKYTVWD